MKNNWQTSTALHGQFIRLEPMDTTHIEGLQAAANDGALWELWFTSVPKPEAMEAYVLKVLDGQSKNQFLPFVVVDNTSNTILGTTRLYDLDPANRRLKIGYTWYAKTAQRTGVNTACKLLLLQYAFESLGCIAVAFEVHWHNHASRQAVLRLGAKQDGILRNHRIMPDGSFRDTVVFSIIASEWPAVKVALSHKLSQYEIS